MEAGITLLILLPGLRVLLMAAVFIRQRDYRFGAIAMLVLAIILAIAIPRGSVGEADAGEDVDPNSPGDWRTVGLLVGLFVLLIVLVKPLGWAIAGALFFGGAATILGNRHYIRNIAIGAVLSVLTFYGFYSGLGIPLPAGILDGIL